MTSVSGKEESGFSENELIVNLSQFPALPSCVVLFKVRSLFIPNQVARIFKPNPHWTPARKFTGNSFGVACVQCEHCHSQQQVTFACICASHPVWIGLSAARVERPNGVVYMSSSLVSSLRQTTSQDRILLLEPLHPQQQWHSCRVLDASSVYASSHCTCGGSGVNLAQPELVPLQCRCVSYSLAESERRERHHSDQRRSTSYSMISCSHENNILHFLFKSQMKEPKKKKKIEKLHSWSRPVLLQDFSDNSWCLVEQGRMTPRAVFSFEFHLHWGGRISHPLKL